MAASAPRFSKPPAIRQIPDDQTRLFLECQVQSAIKPDVSWFRNEEKLPSTSNKYKQNIKLSSPNHYDVHLEITTLSSADAGNYKILVKNKSGEVTANVNLNFSNDENDEKVDEKSTEGTAPSFIQKPLIKQENDGKRLIFECKICADPKAEVFWSRDDVPIADSGRYLIYCDPLPNNGYVACLEIDDVNASDAGKYKITAKNKYGESNAHIQLNLDSKRDRWRKVRIANLKLLSFSKINKKIVPADRIFLNRLRFALSTNQFSSRLNAQLILCRVLLGHLMENQLHHRININKGNTMTNRSNPVGFYRLNFVYSEFRPKALRIRFLWKFFKLPPRIRAIIKSRRKI